MKNGSAKPLALGGVLAALSVTIMAFGGLIPIATFVCPVLCMLCQLIVARTCGNRIAWAWFAAVALLCLVLAPDKEAAAVFLLLGYYPILKPFIDRSRLRILWKGILFNGAVAILYGLLLQLMGLSSLADDYREVGMVGLIIMLFLGNITFFLLDGILSRFSVGKGG